MTAHIAHIKKRKSSRHIAFSYLGVAIAIAVDQITKYLADICLNGKSPFVIIPGVFELRYLENQSAAFGLDILSILHKIFRFSYFDENPDAFLRCKMIFFAVVTLAVLVLLALLYRKIPWERRWLPFNLIILGFMAGAVGNLIDRVTHSYVIDFFYFCLIDFPIFNVADIYVTLSTLAFVIVVLFFYREEDFSFLFPPGKAAGREESSK